MKFPQNVQGFSRVMTRPAGRVKGVSKSRASGRVGSKFLRTSRVGSGRVGSRGFTISPVGSGGVNRLQILAGGVRSGQEVSKSRGSGRVGSRGFENLASRVRS